MNARPPKKVREEVVANLYKKLDSLVWEQLSSREKSAAYTQFVEDSELGGVLSTYMDAGKIRVWIKDGPAKEYVRAIEGVGPYAQHTQRAYPSDQATVAQIMGDDWALIEGSTEEKPMRCEAVSNAGERRFIVWGPVTALKELVWQVLLHRVKQPEIKPVLAITKPSIAPLQPAHRKETEALSVLIGAECKTVVRIATGRRPPPAMS